MSHMKSFITEKTAHLKSPLSSIDTMGPTQIAKKHGVDQSVIDAQLKMGINVEMEHTKDRAVAREIALDHLTELPDYYTRLADMENVKEDLFQVDGDALGSDRKITISASPVRKHEIKKMAAQGKGLRILVGAGKMRNMLVVWVGDGDSNVGATHETIADQFGMSMYNEPHVPLEVTSNGGRLRVTTTAQGQFDDPREVEDVLDRNPEFQQFFGGQRIDYSALTEGEKLELDPIEVGDEVLAGKFKNSKRTVKGFKKDKHGQPVLKTNKGDTSLFKPRISKLS